jgi:hypothetical protein
MEIDACFQSLLLPPQVTNKQLLMKQNLTFQFLSKEASLCVPSTGPLSKEMLWDWLPGWQDGLLAAWLDGWLVGLWLASCVFLCGWLCLCEWLAGGCVCLCGWLCVYLCEWLAGSVCVCVCVWLAGWLYVLFVCGRLPAWKSGCTFLFY